MESHHAHGQHGDGDAVTLPLAQHACVIVGIRHLFLVHMTNLWIDCHRYQAILRVKLPADVKQAFLDDRKAHPTEWHIVGNESSDLVSLPDIQRGKRTSFTGSLWRGLPDPKYPGTPDWPWATQPPVIGGFEVQIEHVVYFRRFDFNLNYPNTPTYILFGAGDEAHLHNYQVKQPEYDHVVTLSGAPKWLPPAALEAGVPVNFPDIPASPGGHGTAGRAVHCTDPLSPGTHYVQYGGLGPRRALTVDRTVWFATWPVNEKDPCLEAHHHG